MIYKKEICLELRKLRHRHTPALFLAVFALISAWMAWCFHDMDISRINDPAAMIYINMLLMNTILCPITAAVLASRMCDMEQIGDTYKWLCTMQKPEHIYREVKATEVAPTVTHVLRIRPPNASLSLPLRELTIGNGQLAIPSK